MLNAHLRMGKLTFARQTRDSVTNITVGLNCLVAEPPDSHSGRKTRDLQNVRADP